MWPTNFHFLPFWILVRGTQLPYREKPKSHEEASVGTGTNSSPPTTMQVCHLRPIQPRFQITVAQAAMCLQLHDQYQERTALLSPVYPWAMRGNFISLQRLPSLTNWEAYITEINFLTVLGSRSQKTRCQHHWLLLRAMKEDLFQAFLLG